MTEQDRQTVEVIKSCLKGNTHPSLNATAALIEIIDRLDKQQQKMQALLERWVEELDGCLISANVKPIYDDTKQFLKEAKEVKG